MGTTPARITPDASASGVALEAGLPGVPVHEGAAAGAMGTGDTERPPALGEGSSDEKTEADVGAVLGATVGRAAPADGPGESTKVGRPPDPAGLAAPRVGPPTPSTLRAAPKPPAPPSAPRPPTSSSPSLGGVRPPAPSAPLAPPRQSPRTMAYGPAPTSSPGAEAEGTAVGLAPSPGAPAAPPVDGRVSTRQIAAAIGDRPLTRRCTSCNALYPEDFLVCPRDATPLVAASEDGVERDPLVGALVGETYQIVRVIGEGGMGRVYEARHLRLKERRFAVKCLHSDLARNPEMAARFMREAETASSIKHENVVDVFDVHHLPDGTPYLVGEYLEGEELAGYVEKRGPLEPRTAAKVARQVCNALSAAHARGIVHRDMKPENIFVLASSIAAVERGESRTLHVKVLDFGISKAGGGDTNLTRTGVIMGTPSYMAPEQARGRPVDHRADVYSLGACLYFMVTGKRPFDSEDPTSTLSMVLTEDPVRPREIDQRIPEMLELIIQRAMAKDANDRYATMAELEKALALFTGQSSLAIPSGHAIVPTPLGPGHDPNRGSSRALDVAHAFMGGPSLSPPAQSSSLARAARPTIVITSSALGAWLVGGTVAALAGLVRVLHDGEITLTESLLLVVGCLFAAATPVALYVMHLRRVIWPNSVKALQLATDLKRVTVSVLVAYGGLSIVGRVVHTVFWRSSTGLASGFWDIALFVLSVIAAVATGGLTSLLRNLRRRRASAH